MKMITKVFLVIAVLIVCLVTWALFLGGGGIIEKGWNGVATQVNTTWKSITGLSTDVVPMWKTTGNVNEAQKNKDTTTP